MKKSTIILASLLCSVGLFAQQHNVKIGIESKLHLTYEYMLTDNQTVSLSTSLLFPKGLPSSVQNSFLEEGGEFDMEYKAFQIMPEYRYYTGGNAPDGFYLGAYAKYKKFSGWFEYVDEGTTEGAKGSLQTIAGGFELGYQWLIADLITVDWTILGLGVGRGNLEMTFVSDDDYIDFKQYHSDIEDALQTSSYPYQSKLELESGDDYLTGKAPLLLPSVRMCLSVGIVF